MSTALRRTLIGGAALVAAGLAWWLGSPLFLDREVNESIAVELASQDPMRSGAFRDADEVHRGSGRALVFESGAGDVLRFEDFEVTNGPELHVLLAVHPDPASRDDLDGAGYVDLGDLKGNVGDQNYALPADVDVSEFGSVVIYCKPFHVVFAVASLGEG